MQKKNFIGTLILFLVFMAISSYPVAAKTPKELINETLNAMDSAEHNARSGAWADAEKDLIQMGKGFENIIKSLTLKNEETSLKIARQLIKAMQKSVKDKEDEEFEVPSKKAQKFMLTLMQKLDYEKPPVFILFERWISEAVEYVKEGKLEFVSEEMEEVINLRKEARTAVKGDDINKRKVHVFFDLAWDIEDALEKNNTKGVKKILNKMNKLLKSI